MDVQIKEWGNSQGVRIPRTIMKEMGVQVEDYLQIEVRNGSIILSRPFRHRTLKERIEESGVPLSGIGELDWGEPQGNEVW